MSNMPKVWLATGRVPFSDLLAVAGWSNMTMPHHERSTKHTSELKKRRLKGQQFTSGTGGTKLALHVGQLPKPALLLPSHHGPPLRQPAPMLCLAVGNVLRNYNADGNVPILLLVGTTS